MTYQPHRKGKSRIEKDPQFEPYRIQATREAEIKWENDDDYIIGFLESMGVTKEKWIEERMRELAAGPSLFLKKQDVINKLLTNQLRELTIQVKNLTSRVAELEKQYMNLKLELQSNPKFNLFEKEPK